MLKDAGIAIIALDIIYLCERDGPFNKIPANHTIGDENCPSFININELKI